MIGSIIALAIRRRWTVVILTLAAAALGWWSLIRLPIDAVPDITNKQVQVSTTAFALSPPEIEQQVTARIELALAGIPGLEQTRSLSRNGFSQVTAIFSDATDIYFARQQVMERLLELRPNLPSGVDPRTGPVSTGLGEVYMWSVGFARANGKAGVHVTPEGRALQSPVERAAYLRTVQDWIVRPQLRTVPGIAGVDSIGGEVKQFHVLPQPLRLAAFGLSFSDVAKAIEAGNVSRGASIIERNGEGIAVRSGGRLQSLDEIGDVVVSTRGGVPVRVRDLAELIIGGEIRTGSASVNGEEAVIGTAMMRVGSNSRTVAAAADAKIDEVRRQLPAGIEITTLLDRTRLVDATIKTVATNLTEGALLVIVILFLMLGNFRAALIAALVIPITMLLTAAGMLRTGVSANLMSLGALDFGLIVDGAIILCENAMRRLAERQGETGGALPLQERLRIVQAAAEEMIAPTVYGQAIIILVYVPLLSFTGIEGKMFEPMALTVVLALVFAFVLSLTFVPAMIAILLTGQIRERENAAVRWLKAIYAPALTAVLGRPVVVMAAAGVIIALAGVLFVRLGQDFIPRLDENDIAVQAVRIPSTALAQSQAMQLDVERALGALPQVATVFSKTGTAEAASDPMPPNVSDTFVILKPRAQWPDPRLDKAMLLKQIEAAVRQLPGNQYEFTQPIEMRFNELIAGVRGDIAIKLFGDDIETLQRIAGRIAELAHDVKGAADIKVERISGLSVLDIEVDKAAIGRRGLTLAAVQDAIGAAIGGQRAGVIFEGDRNFDIVVKLPEAVRNDPEALRRIPVSLPSAAAMAPTVPLGEVAAFRFRDQPSQISRENGKRRIVVSANVRDRDLASVVGDIRSRIDAEMTLPPGYWLEWGGQFENLAKARARLAIVVPLCFAVILLLLTSALGTLRDALLVFSVVPLALTGGVVSLWLRGLPFSISAAVGFIALSGIAVLNGLVMLTFIKQLIAQGVARRDAIVTGAVVRLRPVAMTALVASFGFVPMALATGTGAEVQRPIATVVIGGLVSATLLTLFVLPTLYAVFGRAPAVETEQASVLPHTNENGRLS
ncbi:MAG: CusA/CzcA family heavy metal efflux RND transporter [Xanthobacteraceae bacterium]